MKQKGVNCVFALQFSNLQNLYLQNRKLLMQFKKRNSIKQISLSPRLQKRKFQLSKSKLIADPKPFYNFSSEVAPFSSLSKLKQNHSIKLLNSHRDSSSNLKKNYGNECQTSREVDRPHHNFALHSPIHASFKINNESMSIKSYASTVAILYGQILQTLRSRKISSQPFILCSENQDIALDYYLTTSNSMLNTFLGKNLNLKPYFTLPQQNIKLNSFEIVKVIGSGGFSKVFLVRFKGDGLFYAMKVINKSFILKQKKKQLIMNQRNIMVEVNHPLHTKLHWAFQQRNSIVFVMDYYPGGELFGLIRKFRRMSEAMAKFYIIEVLLALQKLHDLGIAYRDMKPQNILLDREGHVHLADFGLAKPGFKADGARAFSFCGSPQYMPPQIVARKGHTIAVDFYSLGALLYQLVSGLPPFYSRDPQKIYNSTLKQKLTFPPHISKELKNLLQGLLCKQQQKRLGFKSGVRQILSHPWFGKIDVSDYLQKKCCAPISFINLQDLSNHSQINQKNEQLIASLKRQQHDSTHFQTNFKGLAYQRNENSFCTKSNTEQLSKIKGLKIFTKLYKRVECMPMSSSSNRIHKFNNFM